MSRGRGRVVPGTSAKKARLERRHTRREADRFRRAGAEVAPDALTDPDDLAAMAARRRQQEARHA